VLTQFKDLAADHTSGATELIHRLLAVCEGCVLGQCLSDLEEGLAMLEDAQQSMPSFHAVLNILKIEFLPRLHQSGEDSDAIGYLASLRNVLDESGDAVARFFVQLFHGPVRIATISRSGTVISALNLLLEDSLLDHLTVLEARPMSEGLKTIREFNGRIPATLLVDAGMTEALLHADCAVVGADCVSADGYLLNKTGTYPLALCCRERGIPLYVLCDSLKFSPQLRDQILVEDSAESDVVFRENGDTFSVWNRYFEWTPIELITSFITERGVFPPDQLSRLAGE
jgi:translation initiation factor eIF-2B subunit delta